MLSKENITEYLNSEFPQTKCVVEAAGNQSSTVRHAIGFNELRPGGTVAGPVLMAVGDVALYVAILSEIGFVPLVVTTNLSINFLRKPAPDKDIIGKSNLIKVGKLLVVGEVAIYSDGDKEPVAHVVGTYSIPPQR